MRKKRFNPFGIFNGCWIPAPLVRSKVVSPSAKLVYARLARYRGVQSEGWCAPGMASISEETGLSRTTIVRAIKELEDKGLIEVERTFEVVAGKKVNKTNRYYFLTSEILFENIFDGDLK